MRHPFAEAYSDFYAGRAALSSLDSYSDAELADAEFAAVRISELWKTWNYGVETEFCGMSYRTATEEMARVLPNPVRIQWRGGNPDAAPTASVAPRWCATSATGRPWSPPRRPRRSPLDRRTSWCTPPA